MIKEKKLSFDPASMHKKYYPFFERIFYRPIASFLTPWIACSFQSPTLLNIFGFAVGALGICLIAFGHFWSRVIGAAVLIISYILDCIDGQLARGLKVENKFGALLDTSLDSIKESLIFFALAWSYYQETADKTIFLYLIGVLFAQRMFGRTLPRYQFLFHTEVEEIKKYILEKVPKILKFIALLFSESYRSGTIWVIIFIGVITNQIKLTFIYFLLIISILFISLLIRAYQQSKND